jgi:HNH endonuclease
VVRSVSGVAAELRRALASFEPGMHTASDCARIAEELAATEKACGAARLLAARRAVESGAHRTRGYEDPAMWMARQGGTTRNQAKADLETARLLDDCPATKDAALSGEVSVSQAQEITRSEREVPGAEGVLLGFAKDGDLSDLREKARQHRQGAFSPEALHRAQQAARSFRHFTDRLGMIQLRAALPPEAGVPLANRIEILAQRLRRAAKENGDPDESFDAHAADALVQLCSGEPTTARSGRAEVVIVCDVDAWRRGHAHQGEPCHLIGGGPIPVDVAKELSKDAFFKAVLHDGVAISTVKHFGRHLPAELRTALDLGPAPTFTGRRCADCGRRYGLEYDHVVPVASGGPTAFDNLVARCWVDHRAKTERDRKAGLLSKDRGAQGVGRATAPAERAGPSP